MIINRNSWHYKLYAFSLWRKHKGMRFEQVQQSVALNQTNFCRYFNRAITMNVIYALFCLFCLCLLGIATTIALSTGIYFFLGIAWVVAVLGTFALGMATIAGIVSLFDVARKRVLNSPSNEENPNIFVERAKSWKNKVCPIVEVR